MKYENKRFTQAERELLKKTKGSKLISIEAVLAAPPNAAWNTVRLHFESFDIDITNSLSEIVIDEFETREEFGLLSLRTAKSEMLRIPEVGADTTIFHINEFIRSVSVINNVIKIFGNDLLVTKLDYPQAIAFTTDSGTIMLDKEQWFSEMIVIKRGLNASELLYDESVNWDNNSSEDPSTCYDFCVERDCL